MPALVSVTGPSAGDLPALELLAEEVDWRTTATTTAADQIRQGHQHVAPLLCLLVWRRERCLRRLAESIEGGSVRGSGPDQEVRRAGRVSRHIYWVYLLAAGPLLTLVVLSSLLLMQASRNGTDLFIAYWSAHAKSHAPLHFLGALVLLALGNSFLTLIRAFSFANGGMNAATVIHDKLMATVVRAPSTFFDLNPRGRVINRRERGVSIQLEGSCGP